MLTPSRAREIMNTFPDCHVLVVGDLMLDRYIHGRVDRISPEAPVPVLQVEGERSVPGGACNVGLNVQSLGGHSRVCGLVGTCQLGDELIGHLEKAGVDVSGVLRQEEITTIVKTRIVSDRQQMIRIDRENLDEARHTSSEAFRDKLASALQGISSVVLEDYGKGVLQQDVVKQVLDHCKPLGIPSGLDPKDNHELDVRGITVATPNRKEAFTVAGMRDKTPREAPLQDPSLLQASHRLSELWQPENLMVTLGPQGMLLSQKDQKPTHLSTRAREVFDVSGAGDTVIATTMLSLAAGASFLEAAELANIAAGVVVAKLGTATVTQEEILHAMEDV